MPKSPDTDLERLLDLRDRLSAKVRSTKTSPRDLPALSRELRSVLKDIGELQAGDEETTAQKIRREREEKRARRTDSNLSEGSEAS